MASIRESLKAPVMSRAGKLAFLSCLAIIGAAGYRSFSEGPRILAFLKSLPAGGGFLILFCTLSVLTLSELLWRAALAFFYRPVPGCSEDLLPVCTVVVPAFNEGRQVFHTLESLAASDYPRDRLEIIAVDDGSVDDTWQWIRKAKDAFGDRITTIRQPRNLGKKHALDVGFRGGRGEVLVTVDSDSTVDPDTLRNLVAPFVADPKVGAVAGNVRVLNRTEGILPRMLDVVFVYGFDFLRTSQSLVKAVMCTPGALSAYRRSAVMKILQEWLDQTFLGKPATIGEDRALTNLILREGHHVVYQQNSIGYTNVPVTHGNLCKMFLRWSRSDIRETLAMTRFVFRRFRGESMLGARINFIFAMVAVLRTPLVPAIIAWQLLWHPALFGASMLFSLVAFSGLTAVIYAWKFESFSALWAFPYGLYFFLSLSWIEPFSLLTPHKGGWLTRQIKPEPAPAAAPAHTMTSFFLEGVDNRPPSALAAWSHLADEAELQVEVCD